MTYVNRTTMTRIARPKVEPGAVAGAAGLRARATAALRGIALAACLILLAAPPRAARAQTTPSDFRWTTGQAGPFEVAPAATIDVPLYLQSITSAGATLLATENGLFSAGLSIRRSADGGAGGAGATITVITANRAAFPAADTGERIEEVVSPTLARLLEEREQTNGTGSEEVGTARRVRVGTITIAAGDVGDAATYDIRDFVNRMDQIEVGPQTVSGEGSDLDPRIAVGSFTVNTVPEPSALALLGFGALAAVRRRRRASANIPATQRA